MITIQTSRIRLLYILYFVFGAISCCVAIAIRIMERDGAGDLPEDFQAVWIACGTGFVIGLATYILTFKNDLNGKVLYGMWIFIRYFLAFVFLGYGFIKVIGLQFNNSLNQLDSSVRGLSQYDMSVAWFFFGHSNAYEMFLGWGEVVAALLLLFRRTTILGACILVTITANIVAINFWYDVPVKLNSTTYLLMTLWLLIYQHHRIIDFFIMDRSVPASIYPTLSFSKRKLRVIKFINLFVIALLIGYQAWDNFYRLPKEYGYDVVTPLRGVWRLTRLTGNMPDTVWTKTITGAKFYFESFGDGMIKDANETFISSFRHAEPGKDSITISQLFYDSSFYFKGKYLNEQRTLLLTGEWSGVPLKLEFESMPEYFGGAAEIFHTEVKVTKEELDKVVGKYKLASGFFVSIVLRDDKLFRVSATATEVEMVPLGNYRFAYKGLPRFWEFKMNDNGVIDDIVYISEGDRYKVWKVAD